MAQEMNYQLLVDRHKNNARQGPGGDVETKLALSLAGLSDASERLQVADIGCGTGASTLVLAESLNAQITAVDLFHDFLEVLEADAKSRGLAGRITTLAGSMEALPFEQQSLDLIWTEGAIYNMGFENGVKYFKRFLKSGGILAASEITWLTQTRPGAVAHHWNGEYPEIATASEKIRIIEDQGFVLKGYFPLPESCWTENYYIPLENSSDAFLADQESADAKSIIDAEKAEFALYKTYRDFYSYGFYIAQKV